MEASIRADAVMPFPTLTSFLIVYFFSISTTAFCSQHSMSVSCSFCFGLSCHLSAWASLHYLFPPLQCRSTETLTEKSGHAPKTEGNLLLAHPDGATTPVFQYPGCDQNLICWNFIWPRIGTSSNRKHFVCSFTPDSYHFFVLPLALRRCSSPLVCPSLWWQTLWTCNQASYGFN